MSLPSNVQSISFGVTYSVNQVLWSHYICPELSNYAPVVNCQNLQQVFSIFTSTAVSALFPASSDSPVDYSHYE